MKSVYKIFLKPSMLVQNTCTKMIAIFMFSIRLECCKPDSKHFQRKVQCERMTCYGILKGKVDRRLSVGY